MNEHDPFEALRDTKPFPPDDAITDTTAKAALFEEITMSEHNQRNERQARRAASSPTRWRRPTLVAAAAAVVAAGIASTTLNNQSAYAAVIEASEVVAEANSGHVRVEVDLREDTTDGTTESGSFYIDISYAGDDSRIITGGVFEGDDLSGLDDFQLEMIRVGEETYLSNPDGTWTPFPRADLLDDDFFPGLGATGDDPAAMLELLRTAEDMTEASNDDGTTTYVGTITSAAVQALDPVRLPAGIAMIVDEPGSLPPELGLTVTVNDSALRSVRLDAVGDYPGSDDMPGGFVDASITMTYSDINQIESIEPPPTELIVASPFDDESMMANVQILDEFMETNPDLCLDPNQTGMEDTPEEMVAMLEEISACFEREAPPEVAAAWRAMNEQLLDD